MWGKLLSNLSIKSTRRLGWLAVASPELLIKSIEEASKHTKEVLVVLLAASFYILVAVFAGRSTDSVQLPLLGVSVSNNLFLGVSPLLVVVPYLYLQLCVTDLRRRVRVFERLDLTVHYVPSRSLLLFPFVITLGLALRDDTPVVTDADKGLKPLPPIDPYRVYVWTVTVILVWGLAPAILLTLWLRFIDKQQIESLIPCFSLIAAFYGSSIESGRSKAAYIAGVLASLAMVTVSFASVGSLRHGHYLPLAWGIAQKIGSRILSNSSRAFYRNAQIIPILMGLFGVVRWLEDTLLNQMALNEIQNYLENKWIELQDRRGLMAKLASRLLYVAVSSRKPLRSLAVMISVVVVSAATLISLLI